MFLNKRVLRGVLGLTVLGFAGACADDSETAPESAGEDTESSSDPTEGPSSGDGDGDPSPGDGDGDPSPGDGDGDPSPGDGDGDGDPSSGDGDGDPSSGDGDGDAGLCELSGDDCGDCMATHCCAEIQECLGDVDCNCFQACAAATPDDPVSCADPDQCDIPLLSLLDPNTVVGRMSVCTQTNCAQCL